MNPAEYIKIRTDTKCNPCRTMTNGENPSNLRLIDRKMRAAWAVDTLLVQNLHARGRRKRINLDTSFYKIPQHTCDITSQCGTAPLCTDSVHGDYAACCKMAPCWLRRSPRLLIPIPKFGLVAAFLSEGPNPSAFVDNMLSNLLQVAKRNEQADCECWDETPLRSLECTLHVNAFSLSNDCKLLCNNNLTPPLTQANLGRVTNFRTVICNQMDYDGQWTTDSLSLIIKRQ